MTTPGQLRRQVSVPSVVIFDLSEVLVRGIKGVEHALASKLQQVPAFAHLSPEDLHDLMIPPWPEDLFSGRETESAWIQSLLDRVGWPFTIDELSDAIKENLTIPVPETAGILPELREQATLVLLSDNVREWVPHIDQNHTGLFDHFHHLLWSFDLGSSKHHHTTWPNVLRRLGVEADECFFIDDSAGNVALAAENGVRGHVFTDATSLRGALKEVGFRMRPTLELN